MFKKTESIINSIPMSDSDSDDAATDIFTWRNENTILQASVSRGQPVNQSAAYLNNKMMTNLPQNFVRQRYLDNNYLYKNRMNVRETSPMSLRSVTDYQSYNQHYPHEGSSQRSVNDGRWSPQSMRSVSDAPSNRSTVSTKDIVFALKTMKFNRHEYREISNACKSFVRGRRTNISGSIKKRKLHNKKAKELLKGFCRKSGGDSGEQGSDSSLSSDDCRSVRSEHPYQNDYRHARSQTTSVHNFPISSESRLKAQGMLLSQTVRNNNMCIDRTTRLKQHTFKNMFSSNSRSALLSGSQNRTLMQPPMRPPLQKRVCTTSNSLASMPIAEERLSELNRKTIADHSDYNFENLEERNNINKATNPQTKNLKSSERQHCSVETDKHSDKIASPEKIISCSRPNKNIKDDIFPLLKKSDNVVIENKDDFVFTKPKLPSRISASKPAETGSPKPDLSQSSNHTVIEDPAEKSSFMRRKLFTQTLDVTENQTNLNNESLPGSPLTNIYSSGKKNNSKKSVGTRSCLMRSIVENNRHSSQDNLLELVQQIVPQEEISVITGMKNIANIMESSDKRTSKHEERFDINSIISTCNQDDFSDTYTDEEDIFHVKQKVDENNHMNKPEKQSAFNDSVDKSDHETQREQQTDIVKKPDNTVKNTIKKKPSANINAPKLDIRAKKPNANVTNKVLSFWKTDEETDAETTNIEGSRNPKLKAAAAKDKTTKKQNANITNKALSFWNTDSDTELDTTRNDTVISKKQNNKKNVFNSKDIDVTNNVNRKKTATIVKQNEKARSKVCSFWKTDDETDGDVTQINTNTHRNDSEEEVDVPLNTLNKEEDNAKAINNLQSALENIMKPVLQKVFNEKEGKTINEFKTLFNNKPQDCIDRILKMMQEYESSPAKQSISNFLQDNTTHGQLSDSKTRTAERKRERSRNSESDKSNGPNKTTKKTKGTKCYNEPKNSEIIPLQNTNKKHGKERSKPVNKTAEINQAKKSTTINTRSSTDLNKSAKKLTKSKSKSTTQLTNKTTKSSGNANNKTIVNTNTLNLSATHNNCIAGARNNQMKAQEPVRRVTRSSLLSSSSDHTPLKQAEAHKPSRHPANKNQRPERKIDATNSNVIKESRRYHTRSHSNLDDSVLDTSLDISRNERKSRKRRVDKNNEITVNKKQDSKNNGIDSNITKDASGAYFTRSHSHLDDSVLNNSLDVRVNQRKCRKDCSGNRNMTIAICGKENGNAQPAVKSKAHNNNLTKIGPDKNYESRAILKTVNTNKNQIKDNNKTIMDKSKQIDKSKQTGIPRPAKRKLPASPVKSAKPIVHQENRLDTTKKRKFDNTIIKVDRTEKNMHEKEANVPVKNYLGFAKATIGIIPRHAGKSVNMTYNEDDNKSIAKFSTTSTSIASRRRRYLHVF